MANGHKTNKKKNHFYWLIDGLRIYKNWSQRKYIDLVIQYAHTARFISVPITIYSIYD